jgi:hypothetical protein
MENHNSAKSLSAALQEMAKVIWVLLIKVLLINNKLRGK